MRRGRRGDLLGPRIESEGVRSEIWGKAKAFWFGGVWKLSQTDHRIGVGGGNLSSFEMEMVN